VGYGAALFGVNIVLVYLVFWVLDRGRLVGTTGLQRAGRRI